MTVRVVSAPPSSTRTVSSRIFLVDHPSVLAHREMRSSLGSVRRVLDQIEGDPSPVLHDRDQVRMRHVGRAGGRCLTGQEHDPLGPPSHALPHVARVAEQVAGHHRGKARGDGLDRFAFADRRHLVEDLGDDLTDGVLVVAHAAGRELPGDDVALRLVLRVVQVDHRLVGALVDVWPRSFGRRVAGAVALDRHDVLVARDDPDPLHRVPEHRGLLPEPPVRVPRIDVELGIEDVDLR